MNLLKVDPDILLFGLRVNCKSRWAALFMGRYGVVLVGTGEDKEDDGGTHE